MRGCEGVWGGRRQVVGIPGSGEGGQDCGLASKKQEAGLGPAICARSKPCSWKACGSPGLLRFVLSKLVAQIQVDPLGLLLHYPK